MQIEFAWLAEVFDSNVWRLAALGLVCLTIFGAVGVPPIVKALVANASDKRAHERAMTRLQMRIDRWKAGGDAS